MAVYLHTILLIILGATLVESGIKLISIQFWLIVIIILGIVLTYDLMIHEPYVSDEDEDKKPK